MTMKHRYLILATLPILASCGVSPDAKVVDSLDDFIAVAAVDEIKIQTISSSEHAISAASGEANRNRSPKTARAYYYDNDDYRIEVTGDNHIGYTLVNDNGVTQYCLINTKTNIGTVHSNPSSLNAERDATKNELRRQYGVLVDAYEKMKSYAGKTAAELGYDKFEFRRSIAPEVAGYVVLTSKTDGETRTDANYYLMMDKVGDKWAFTNYEIRVTTYVFEDGQWAKDIYDVSEYQVTVADSYTKIAINLNNYTLTMDGVGINDVAYDDGCPLTAR